MVSGPDEQPTTIGAKAATRASRLAILLDLAAKDQNARRLILSFLQRCIIIKLADSDSPTVLQGRPIR
jgi:hypothetical protein